MEFGEAISNGFRNYATFTGRAARSEYWYWVLFNVIVSAVTTVIDIFVFPSSGVSPINTIAMLALLLPSIAVLARRVCMTSTAPPGGCCSC